MITDGFRYKTGVCYELASYIELLCEDHGLHFYRWVNNSYPYIRPGSSAITYAVLRGERPNRACEIKESDAIVTRFVGMEGLTTRCRAFKHLDYIFQEVVHRVLPGREVTPV